MQLVLTILAAFAAIPAHAGTDHCAIHRAEFQFQPAMLSLGLYQATQTTDIPGPDPTPARYVCSSDFTYHDCHGGPRQYLNRSQCGTSCGCYNGVGFGLETCEGFFNCHADEVAHVCSELGRCRCA